MGFHALLVSVDAGCPFEEPENTSFLHEVGVGA